MPNMFDTSADVDPLVADALKRLSMGQSVLPPAPSPQPATPYGGQTFGDPNYKLGNPPNTPDVPSYQVNVPMSSAQGDAASRQPVSNLNQADQIINQAAPNTPPAMQPVAPTNPRGALPPTPAPLPSRIPMSIASRPTGTEGTNVTLSALWDYLSGKMGRTLTAQQAEAAAHPAAPATATAPSRTLISPPMPAPQPAIAMGGAPTRAAAPASSPGQPAAPLGSPAPQPPGISEDRSDNVAMGTGPGSQVPHNQAAAVAAGAGNLGTQVANNPDVVNGIIKDLQSKGLANDPMNFWMALAQAGFATMASRSPFALQAVGEGMSAGLDSYNKMRGQSMQQRIAAANLAREQEIAQRQAAYERGMLGNEQRRTDVEVAKLPTDIAEGQARANYYGTHGDYLSGRLAQLGGNGPNNKAEIAAYKSTVDRQLQALKANPPANLPQDQATQQAWAAQMQDAAIAYADEHPEQWRNGGLPSGGAATAPQQPALPQGAVGYAPPGAKEGQTAYQNGKSFIVRGGFVYPQ